MTRRRTTARDHSWETATNRLRIDLAGRDLRRIVWPAQQIRPEGHALEVLWGPFFFVVTLVIPLIVAPLVVRDLGGIYARVGARTLAAVLVCGFLWGLGSMTLGKSFAFIGLSLAYALNYGAQIIFGSMLPLLLLSPHEILTQHGCVILAGVAVCVAGVVVCGRAGILKDRQSQPATGQPSASGQPRMLAGLALGVVSGVLCACYALASAYADPVGKEAAQNNPDWAAAWAVTALILWGGAVSSCTYCVIQLTKNRTWAHLARPGIGLTLLLATVMAVLHDAAIFFFGLGWINVGNLGVPVGYPVFMSFAIIVGNIHGFRTGEWKQASPPASAGSPPASCC